MVLCLFLVDFDFYVNDDQQNCNIKSISENEIIPKKTTTIYDLIIKDVISDTKIMKLYISESVWIIYRKKDGCFRLEIPIDGKPNLVSFVNFLNKEKDLSTFYMDNGIAVGLMYNNIDDKIKLIINDDRFLKCFYSIEILT